ncbi:MAG: alpha/beta hydrolase family protein, partial [Kiritimatiellae bacterium]|nr:alpha/beta hydrolase family protein [Kiritimatiellia bacterium]
MNKYALQNRCGLTGIVDRFRLLGPLNADGRLSPGDALATDLLKDLGGETALDTQAFARDAIPYVIGAGFKVNLVPLAPNCGSIVYALALLESPRAQPATIRLGSDKGYRLFVNDREIGYLDECRGLAPDNSAHAVTLRKGINVVLMKVQRIWGGYEFMLRIEAKVKVVQRFDLPKGYPAETLRFDDAGAHPTDFTGRLRYSGVDYLAGLAEECESQLAFRARDRQAWRRWNTTLRRKLLDLMGPEPERDNRPPLTLSREDIGDGLVREKIAIRTYRDSDVPCYLIRPAKPKGKLPCMLAIHGHGAGAYPVAGVTFGTKFLSRSIEQSNYDYGLKLAKAGFVVL